MTKKRQEQRDFSRRRRWFRFFRALTIFTFIFFALGMGFLVGLFASVSKVLPKGEALADIRPPVPTRILAADGTLLYRDYQPETNRKVIPIDEMGDDIQNATLAIEDVRFYSHPGVDMRGIARALRKNIMTGSTREGASTITQQLARNLYLTSERKVTRKLQEVLLALELERRYSKAEILETYLNQVYYGSNTNSVQSYGVEMAAENYFGKSAHKLTLAEAALLAGLPKNPRDYSPYRDIDRAKQRRNLVLFNMLHYKYISREQYLDAKSEPIRLAPEKAMPKMADAHAPYFVRDILNNELPRIFGQDASRLTYNYGIDIYTSIDPRIQKVAEETVTSQVEKNRFRNLDDGALIAIDPQTGLIKAMVGGTDYNKDQFNIVTQGLRQPGSGFKPFVYTTAMLHGYTPKTTVFDRSRSYPQGVGMPPWRPKNSDGRYYGAIPLERALWQSRNCAAASIAYDVGIKEVIKIAHRMGIKHSLEPVLSTALGASVVRPIELCSAYGVLANGGVYHPPTGVLRVTTSQGEVLYEYRPQPRRALPKEIADSMQEVMHGVITRGTARSAADLPFYASGKTGTTNSYRDAWFTGYTDDLAMAVWVGNRSNKEMNRTFGATVPVPIWKEVMKVAQPIMAAEHKAQLADMARINTVPDLPPGELDRSPTAYIAKLLGKAPPPRETKPAVETPPREPQPGDEYQVTVCLQTGDKATPWCPDTTVVTYIKGQQPSPPQRLCSVHTRSQAIPSADDDDNDSTRNQRNSERGVMISICAETGKIATENCPTVLMRRFRNNAPTETCPLHGN